MRILFAVLRLAIAGLTIAAIVAQLVRTISVWTKAGVDDLSQLFVNFFSFFTIDSNVLAVVTLLIGAVLILARKPTEPRWYGVLRGTAVTYMTVTFVVYNLLLRNVELPQGSTVPWSNEVLHVVAPLWMIVDWIFAPGRRELVWRTIWIVVAFPILWVIYTLIRGPITTNALTGDPYWYPYPFLNPNISENGYLSVAFYVILIAMVICVTAAGMVWVSKRKAILKD